MILVLCLPTTAIQFSLKAKSLFDGILTTTLSSDFLNIVPKLPAA